jgi:predicted nucleotidyltransferase
MDKQAIITFLKSNKDFFRTKYSVEKIGIFGSYSKNEETEASDIDIIVSMPSSFDNYFDLKEYLEENLHCSVDLGLESSMRELIKLKIKNEIIYV